MEFGLLTISLDDLFNSNSDFEVEHIIPKSISEMILIQIKLYVIIK